jgi:hypothetical protein
VGGFKAAIKKNRILDSGYKVFTCIYFSMVKALYKSEENYIYA